MPVPVRHLCYRNYVVGQPLGVICDVFVAHAFVVLDADAAGVDGPVVAGAFVLEIGQVPQQFDCLGGFASFSQLGSVDAWPAAGGREMECAGVYVG